MGSAVSPLDALYRGDDGLVRLGGALEQAGPGVAVSQCGDGVVAGYAVASPRRARKVLRGYHPTPQCGMTALASLPARSTVRG